MSTDETATARSGRTRLKKSLRSTRGNEHRQGAVTVEFAFCATIFFMFIFTMLEFTRFVYVRHAVQMVAYEASRAGIIPGATAADVQARAATLMTATGVRVYNIAVNPTNITNLTENVSVTINCDFAANSWVPPTFLTNRTISATIQLQHENMAYLQPGDTDLASIFGDNESEPLDE